MNTITEIGIVDTRNIVKTVLECYGFDLSNYALTSLKRRFERIITLQNLRNADHLVSKIKSTNEYFDEFLKDFLVETTEMFRDPSMWRWLRDNYFNDLLTIDTNYKIWLPDCVGGDELFSLCILLKESDLLDKVEIIATSIHETQVEKLKSGKSKLKKMETGAENYKRYNGLGNFGSYYTEDDQWAYRNLSLINDVEFKVLDITKDDLPKHVNLILYRNHFIYFNQTLQDSITERLLLSLKNGGLLIIGNKEMLGRQFLNEFVLINHSESVYKKR